jgi:hypothetical protein
MLTTWQDKPLYQRLAYALGACLAGLLIGTLVYFFARPFADWVKWLGWAVCLAALIYVFIRRRK